MNKYIHLFAAIVLYLILGCSSKVEDHVLRVGMDLSYPPFETIDSTGAPMGVSVDLANSLGTYLQRPVVIENIPFTGLIPSLMTGKIDIIISSMSETPERHKAIEFSDPYVTSIGLCLLANKKSEIQNIKQLDVPGRKIAIRQGTTGQLWAQQNLKNAKLVILDKESYAVMDVIEGKVDGFLYDQLSVWKYNKEHPTETTALLQPVKSEPWAMGLRLQDKELKARINLFLKKFRNEGGFSRLGDKYLKEEKEAFAKEGIPFSFN